MFPLPFVLYPVPNTGEMSEVLEKNSVPSQNFFRKKREKY